MSGNWDNGTPEPVPLEEDRLCWTNFMPIHIPAMRTKGTPIPTPTPRPTLTVSVLELALEGDAEGVFEVLWVVVLKVELAIMLVVKEVGDVKAVDELELNELDLDELELDVL